MNSFYRFCPNCKEELSRKEEKIFCKSCEFVTYINPAACASAIPVKDDKILIAIRGTEPFKGSFDLIGGFIKQGESSEEGIIREVKEETGLTVEIERYFGSYPDTYGDGDKPVLGITFIVKIISGELKAQDDVAELVWVEIKDIPKLKFDGFQNIKTTLMDFYDQFSE